MAFDIGSADQRGVCGIAHQEMLRKIMMCATGCGRVVSYPFVGTGTGIMTITHTTQVTQDEVFIVTFTGASEFSVVGTVSGSQPNATLGEPYLNDFIGFTIIAGDTPFAIGDSFTVTTKASSLPVGQRWQVIDYRTPAVGSHELYLKGFGISEDKEIFIGFRTYENVAADYYNLTSAMFIGHEPGALWASQPGMMESGIPAHNQNINYWIQVDGHAINIALGVGSPVVYESGGAGLFLPYALPNQYRYPGYVCGMLNGAAAIRYSETTHTMGWKGNRVNLRIRNTAGAWVNAITWPWSNAYVGGATSQLRDTGGEYPMLGIQLYTAADLWGQLDGIRYVSNFNNTVESVVQHGGSPVLDNPTWSNHQLVQAVIDSGGEPWVCLQDVGRTSFNDYFSMRMV